MPIIRKGNEKKMIRGNLIINPDERVQISLCINDDVDTRIYKPCAEVSALIFFQKVNNESYPKHYYCFLFCNLLLQWASNFGQVLCWTYLHTQFCKILASSFFRNLIFIFINFYDLIGIKASFLQWCHNNKNTTKFCLVLGSIPSQKIVL